MYKFLAMRIHDGYLTWDAVEAKGDVVYKAVKSAYTKMYGEEPEEPTEPSGEDEETEKGA